MLQYTDKIQLAIEHIKGTYSHIRFRVNVDTIIPKNQEHSSNIFVFFTSALSINSFSNMMRMTVVLNIQVASSQEICGNRFNLGLALFLLLLTLWPFCRIRKVRHLYDLDHPHKRHQDLHICRCQLRNLAESPKSCKGIAQCREPRHMLALCHDPGDLRARNPVRPKKVPEASCNRWSSSSLCNHPLAVFADMLGSVTLNELEQGQRLLDLRGRLNKRRMACRCKHYLMGPCTFNDSIPGILLPQRLELSGVGFASGIDGKAHLV